MIDPEILKKCGTTNERLREVLTAVKPENYDTLEHEEKDAIDQKVKSRERLEKEFRGKVLDHVTQNLRNHYLYSAVDLAWDAPPITPRNFPLILYAQGKIKIEQCVKQLADLKCADEFVKKNDKGEIIGLDEAAFFEVSVNLVRSMVQRRLAAQSNKYQSLFPHFKFESRGSSTLAKFRADVVSQRMDIMADDYDYKHHEVQVARDTLLYARCVDFPRTAWEVEKEWVKKPAAADVPEPKLEWDTKISREGLVFVNPHISRVFADNASAISSINSDTGCDYIGFWDVTRWGNVKNNPLYFNRDKITYAGGATGIVDVFSNYESYFSQYYCNLKAPSAVYNFTGSNDRKNSVGLYASQDDDTSVFVTEFFKKLIPKDYGIGDYPFPIWTRFTLAGDSTPVFAEIYPSRPAAYCGLNENDARLVNLSFAMQIMPYQDQMSNLFSQLLLVCKHSMVKVAMVDTSLLTPDQVKQIRRDFASESLYVKPVIVEFNGNELKELGITTERTPVKLLEAAQVSNVIQVIFRAMLELVAMAERLEAMSPNESGQPNPREVSATEVNEISNTTTSVYSFFSDSIDEYRAAKKRICFESWMAMGQDQIKLPVLGRYSKGLVEKAGFKNDENEEEGYFDSNTPRDLASRTVIGSKNMLRFDYIFTSRDGAERPSNTAAANVLVQTLNMIRGDPELRQAVGKEKIYNLLNEICRLSSNFDLGLELREGEPNTFPVPQEAQAPLGPQQSAPGPPGMGAAALPIAA